MHHALVASHGHMPWWFNMDLSTSPLSGHGFPGILPYLGLIAIAVFLQYFQMKQMNSRNPQAAAANPQMQTMQKIFPIAFGAIYLKVPAGATIYMVVSSAMRILTQEVMFRSGMVTAVVGRAGDRLGEGRKEGRKEGVKTSSGETDQKGIIGHRRDRALQGDGAAEEESELRREGQRQRTEPQPEDHQRQGGLLG